MSTVPRFGRWGRAFDAKQGIERVEFIGPGQALESRPAYRHQPATLAYDHHGYEAIQPEGEPQTAVRFTPTQVGAYRWRALRGDTVVEQGEFTCETSDHPGFVAVSRRDPRYFAFSDGASYCPIGLNLVGPPSYALPRSAEHFATSGRHATMGCRDYARWLRELGLHGGNFARLWLSHDYFNVETETAGDLDLTKFARLDTVIELARASGVRLKLTLEHFRVFEEGRSWALKTIRHPDDGRRPASVAEWFQDEAWRRLWLKKVDAYLARYGDDPTVMAWELWNEINCCDTGDWAIQRDWTRDMLCELKRRAPRNLVTNSIGSYDSESATPWYQDFHMPEMDFQQVHRYLDQGAPLEICRTNPVHFSIDAIQRTRRPDRPVLLAETGAVNDNHTGPFRFYRWDSRGILFHDTTYPAFFAGAAGPGQIWHWDAYVDQKDLWPAFRPFAQLVEGLQLDAERFMPLDLSSPEVWFLVLQGERHLLGLVRNKADRWERVLRDGESPPLLRDQTFDLAPLGVQSGRVALVGFGPAEVGQASLADGRLKLPAFTDGLMVKVEY